jgi:hypothetical protein
MPYSLLFRAVLLDEMVFPEFFKAGETKKEGSDSSLFFCCALSLGVKPSRKRRESILAANSLGT